MVTHKHMLRTGRHVRALDTAIVTHWTLPNIGDVIRGEQAQALLKRSDDNRAMLPYWDLTDALVDGADAVREAGKRYLPKFPDETDADYAFRLEMTKFTNVYRDIIENLANKPFQEDVSLPLDDARKAPTDVELFIEDVDGAGTHITGFAATTFFNGINSAIDWIFVDFPTVDPSVVRTIAEAKQAGVRPFWSHVLGRNVLDAQVEIINGKEVLTHVRIHEPGKPEHVRVFHRDIATGEVHWVLYRKIERTTGTEIEFMVVALGMVSIGVIPLVPYWVGRRDGRRFRFFPAMRDAADLQREVYQQESALKYAKVLSAYPMLAGNGVKPELDATGKAKRIAIGPGRVLYAPPGPNGEIGSWDYVQPGASTLEFLSKDVERTIQNLRDLGRQPLTAQSGNITVITSAIAAGKANTAVGAWAMNLKNALENALVLTCMWLGISTEIYDPEVSVFMDFDEVSDATTDLEQLRQARDKGDLSQLTYWEELKRRRVLSSEFTPEREVDRLLHDMPVDQLADDVDET